MVLSTNKLKDFLRRYRFIIGQLFRNQPRVYRQIRIPIERHGSGYGGWVIKQDSINKDSTIYSFGIGEDISFDLSLIKRYNVIVNAFDPTPKVTDFLNQQDLPDNFNYYRIGIACNDGDAKFYLPQNKNFISHSIIEKNLDNKYITVPVKKLSTLMRVLGHSKIDILKMDIEGIEYDVIQNILKEGLEIQQILVEFHHFFKSITAKQTEECVEKLNKFGYLLYYISPIGREFSFIKAGSKSI